MKRRLKVKNLIVFIVILLFSSTLLFSAYKIIEYLRDNKENEEIKKEIEDSIIINEDEENDVDKFEIDFKTLKEKNNDAIAYLRVNNTNIDYIVVKGKDNSFYLSHNFNKKYNVSGWIFADFHNKFDESDKNIVIYGHNTQDGSMFGTLKNIFNKDWYENKDNYDVLLITENNTYYYEVFSIYSIIAEDYYINTIFKNDLEFNEFVNKIKARSIHNFKVDVNGSDQILTLSSCTTDGKKRVVLHARLKNNN